MKNIIIYLLGIGTVVGIVVLSSYQNITDPTIEAMRENNNQHTQTNGEDYVQKVFAPTIPDSVHLAGEYLPMDNFDVRERFDRELLAVCFRHSATLLHIKKAHRYFPIIEPILEKNGLPNDFKYLAVAESGLRNATSPAGAKGFWQFMKETAKGYNMVVDSEVDERYHLEKSTEAACKYLNKAYKQYGSWMLAAASYNMGRGRLNQRLEEQGANSYVDLYLNAETSRYVFRILAIKTVMSNPEKYGLNVAEEGLYPAFPKTKEIEVSGSVGSLPDFAKKHGTSYRMLKVLNPWLVNKTLYNKYKRTYKIRVPE